jgi:hypothetical protein
MSSNNFRRIKILFVGHGGVGSNASSLFTGLQSNVDRAVLVDTKFFDSPAKISVRRIILYFFPKFYGYVSSQIIGRIVWKRISIEKPDIFFAFKGNYLNGATLKRIDCLKVHYHPDDSSNPINRTAIFNGAESFYDIHFTSKKHNVSEIYHRTDKKVFFIWYAYDERWQFRATPLNFDYPKYQIGFIGHMRPDRSELILNLANKYGKKFAISGLKWDRIRNLQFLASLYPPSYGELFSSFVAMAPVQLGLLNSDNRDQHTARSFEIPAAGGLILAEDTAEHREIFVSEDNAIFFKSENDLYDKLSWIEAHPEKAQKIAENGFLHITRNKNTWKDRASEILNTIFDMNLK